MTQVNTCLKLIFTVFNIILGLIAAMIISLAILIQVVARDSETLNMEHRYVSIIIMYIVGGGALLIAALGVYASHKEKYAAIVVYTVLMVCGSLLILRLAIQSAIVRPQLNGELEEFFRHLTPLNRAPEDAQRMMNNVQSAMHCCGLFSADDWNMQFPDSCLCDPEEEDQCRVVSYLSFLRQQKSVYSQTCMPLIMPYILWAADVMLGVMFSVAALVLMGLVLSSLIVHQMRFSKSTPTRVAVPAIYSYMPPKYEELKTPPSY